MNESEFPTVLHYLYYPREFALPHELELAKFWSQQCGCSTIVDGSNYGLDESPFWSVICNNGDFFLADDCGSDFGERNNSGEKVKIIRKLDC